jgi:hypothetical protein
MRVNLARFFVPNGGINTIGCIKLHTFCKVLIYMIYRCSLAYIYINGRANNGNIDMVGYWVNPELQCNK